MNQIPRAIGDLGQMLADLDQGNAADRLHVATVCGLCVYPVNRATVPGVTPRARAHAATLRIAQDAPGSPGMSGQGWRLGHVTAGNVASVAQSKARPGLRAAV